MSRCLCVPVAGGHARFLFQDTALQIETEHSGEVFTIHDHGSGAFEITFTQTPRFFGLGSSAETPDRSGGPFRMVTVDTQVHRLKGASYSAFPVLWTRFGKSSRMAAFVLASSFPYEIRLGERSASFKPLTDLEGEGTDIVVLEGDAQTISERLAHLTGMPALPPVWALGYHQSRWSYKTEQEVLDVATALRAHGLPGDAIHLDIHYMHDYRVFTWHPERFPDPLRLHKALAEKQLRTVAIVDPGVAQRDDDATYTELSQKKYFLQNAAGEAYVGKVWPGRSLFPDFLRKEVREAWAKRHAVLLEAGVSGIWNDMNEPTLHNTRYIEPTTTGLRHHESSHNRVRNLYANRMAEAAYDAQKAVHPDKRPFVLTRSGFLGVQKHAALWTGDNFSHWSQLRANLHQVLNLGLCGVPLTGADVGGFGSCRGPLGLLKFWRPNKELYIRWMELGSFMPFFRGHTTQWSPRQEPWSFGKEVLVHARAALERRYRYMPTLYALAREASETGRPIVRPSWYHADTYQGDAPDDAFFFGRDMLVFPVLHAKQREVDVSLPDGEWINVHTDTVLPGGHHSVTAPLGATPHFIRNNAILFTTTGALSAPEALSKRVCIDIYAGDTNDGSERDARLVLDDGETDPKAASYRSTTIDVHHRQEQSGSVISLGWGVVETVLPALEVRIRGVYSHVAVDGRLLETRADGRWTALKLEGCPKDIRFYRHPPT